MNKAIYIIIAFLILLSGDKINGESNESIPIADSCTWQKQQALIDFQKGEFKVAYMHCDSNEYYAEEIFFTRYNLKIEIGYVDIGCVVPGPEELEYQKRLCYYRAIDSLLYLQLGKDIYDRVQNCADSFAMADPHRYDCQPFGQPVYCPNNDSIIPDLRKVLKYPAPDCMEGVVYVTMVINTSGDISEAVIKKGVRHDLDSAAIEGVRLLGKFTPVRRWGIAVQSQLTLPIRFSK